jgi:putative flippase GtrA
VLASASLGIANRSMTFLKSTAAGSFATLADLAVLTLLCALGIPARVASIPALLAGGVVNFVGNRNYAFSARGANDLHKHLSLFALVELFALALNALIFDLAVRGIPAAAAHVVIARLIIGNVVFVCFSYPLWRRIFQPRSVSKRR